MKHILMIGTGGTIASDITDSGLTPELDVYKRQTPSPLSRSPTPPWR